MWRDDALVLDIVIAASDARTFVDGLDWEDFRNSRLHQNAVIHRSKSSVKLQAISRLILRTRIPSYPGAA